MVSSLSGCKGGGKTSTYCYAYQWNLEKRAGFIDSGWKCPNRGISRIPKPAKKARDEKTALHTGVKKVVSVEDGGGGRRRGPGIKKL